MNKLEELIENRINQGLYLNGNPESIPVGLFKLGSSYVLSLDLPVKFAEWLNKHWIPFDDGLWESFGNTHVVGQVIETTEKLYEFWLNNVYDGK